MRNKQFVNIMTITLVISVLLLGMTGDITISIDTPPSGLHTRNETVYVRGSVSDTTISEVEIALDGATIGKHTLSCKNKIFFTDLTLGAGKTSVSVQAIVDGNYIESGIIIYRDCSVSVQIDSRDAFVNSDNYYLAHPVKIISGHSMIPLREFARFFGATVGWHGKTRNVTVSLGRLESSIKLGSNEGIIDGNKVSCNPSATSIFGTTYVPSRFFSQMVGGGVSWDNKLRRLTVGVP